MPDSSPDSWHFACNLDQLTGRACEVVIGPRIIAVFKTDDGIYATDGMCAHQGGPIAKGQVDGNCVTCPWHGWQYDVTDGKNILTGRQMLSVYDVEVRGDEVWINVREE